MSALEVNKWIFMHIKKHLNFSSLRGLLSDCFNKIPEFRQNAKISYRIDDAMMSGFACMYFQEPSLLQFQERMQKTQHRNNLATIFNVKDIPKDSQLRNIVDEVAPSGFEYFFEEYARKLQRGKQLEEYQILPNLYLHTLDATGFFSSENINCEHCLTKTHNKGEDDEKVRFMHQTLQVAIMHPDKRQVIPLMPEEIKNTDGQTKQDCETNAAKRLIEKLYTTHPRRGIILLGDDIYSRQPMIEEAKNHNMHYLFVAKPSSHKYLQEWIDAYKNIYSYENTDFVKGDRYVLKWINKVPLHGGEKAPLVNYLLCLVYKKNKKTGEEKLTYQNSWVTDIGLDKGNVYKLARGGRCRWRIENECFNTLKTQGYSIEHNYGHGEKNLCFNFYLLTLIAFSFHQVFELTDKLYQACRVNFGSKRHMWEKLRAYIDILVFEFWEDLLVFALNPCGIQRSKPPG
jgi:hypothetical protein